MTSPAVGPSPGTASLTVDLVAGLSTVTSARSHQPAKLLVPVPRGPGVWACTSSFGGGLVAGDQTRLDIRLGPGTRCCVGSQASSKIYRAPAARASSHVTTADIGPGALLVFAPDPVQPFSEASYSQTQRFSLAPSAALVLVDWINAGRSARGERWAFHHLRSLNEILVGTERAFLDTLVLNPADGPLTAPHRLGRFNGLALLTLVGPALQPHAERIHADISHRPTPRRAPLLVTSSPLRDGVLVRIAGVDSETIGAEIRRHLAFLREMLPDNPWDRKG
ncbi:MAG: urease accessory protein UreD [Limisphaerales bacterium]